MGGIGQKNLQKRRNDKRQVREPPSINMNTRIYVYPLHFCDRCLSHVRLCLPFLGGAGSA